MTDISDSKKNELDVEETMKKIRNNVMKRYGAKLESRTDVICPEFNSFSCDTSNIESNLKKHLDDINFSCYNTNNNYFISSHRPILGNFLVEGRKLVHGEVKRYVDPVFSNQTFFNSSVFRMLDAIANQSHEFELKFTDLETNLNHLESNITNKFSESINKIKVELKDLNAKKELLHELELKFTDLESKLNNFESNFSNEIKELQSKNESLNELELKLFNLETKFKKELESKKGDSCWAKLYSEEITEQDLINNIEYHEYFIQLIKKYSEKSSNGRPPKIIEVGLGNGTMSVYFSRDCYYDVYGIDNDIQVLDHNIKLNNKLGGYAKFMLLDAFDLNLFQDKLFDVAFSQGTLEHFDNESIIKLIEKQLAVSKYVIFSVPSLNWPTRELGNERKISLKEWEIIMKNAGFNIINLEYYKDDLHIVGVVSS